MNIFKVNGVWQLGKPGDEHEQEHEDIPSPQEHVTDDLPQPKIPHNSDVNTNLGESKIYRKVYQT